MRKGAPFDQALLHRTYVRSAFWTGSACPCVRYRDRQPIPFGVRGKSDAVVCAMDIDRALVEHNTECAEAETGVRIGISAGEPIEEDNRLSGSPVQPASRLCDHARPVPNTVSSVVKERRPGKTMAFSDGRDASPGGIEAGGISSGKCKGGRLSPTAVHRPPLWAMCVLSGSPKPHRPR